MVIDEGVIETQVGMPDVEFSQPHFENLGIRFATASIKSNKHSRNEDNLCIMHKREAAAVYDGLGGHDSGDVASRLAAHVVQDSLEVAPRVFESQNEAEELVNSAILSGHQAVAERNEAENKAETEKDKLTTAVVALPWEDEFGNLYVTVGHVGDSRGYLDQGNTLRALTLDDGLLRYRKEGEHDIQIPEAQARIIQQKLSNVQSLEELSEDEMRIWVERYIVTQSLGWRGRDIDPHVRTFVIQPGDRLLLCSDGLHDVVTDERILEILKQNPEVDDDPVAVQ